MKLLCIQSIQKQYLKVNKIKKYTTNVLYFSNNGDLYITIPVDTEIRLNNYYD